MSIELPDSATGAGRQDADLAQRQQQLAAAMQQLQAAQETPGPEAAGAPPMTAAQRDAIQASRTNDNLHAYMEKNNWYRQINGSAGESDLPHAMYQGSSENSASSIASALEEGVEANVWTRAIVLVISAQDWGLDPA